MSTEVLSRTIDRTLRLPAPLVQIISEYAWEPSRPHPWKATAARHTHNFLVNPTIAIIIMIVVMANTGLCVSIAKHKNLGDGHPIFGLMSAMGVFLCMLSVFAVEFRKTYITKYSAEWRRAYEVPGYEWADCKP